MMKFAANRQSLNTGFLIEFRSTTPDIFLPIEFCSSFFSGMQGFYFDIPGCNVIVELQWKTV